MMVLHGLLTMTQCPYRAGFIEDNIIRPWPCSFKLHTANWLGAFAVLNFWIWNSFKMFKNLKTLQDIRCKVPLPSSNADGWPSPQLLPSLRQLMYLFLFVSWRFSHVCVCIYKQIWIYLFFFPCYSIHTVPCFSF